MQRLTNNQFLQALMKHYVSVHKLSLKLTGPQKTGDLFEAMVMIVYRENGGLEGNGLEAARTFVLALFKEYFNSRSASPEHKSAIMKFLMVSSTDGNGRDEQMAAQDRSLMRRLAGMALVLAAGLTIFGCATPYNTAVVDIMRVEPRPIRIVNTQEALGRPIREAIEKAFKEDPGFTINKIPLNVTLV